jgi:hypothetical protein
LRGVSNHGPMAKRGAVGAAGGRLTQTGDAASGSINWDRATSGRNWPHPPDTQVVDLPVPALDRAFKSVIPLLYRSDRRAQLELTGDEKDHEIAATLSKAWGDGYTSVLMRNYTTPGGKTPRDILAVRDPAQLRSPFARFDPAKRNSSDLLASIAGFPLAAGVAGSAIKYGLVPVNPDPFADSDR